ncbi:MAG: hypothetical protein K6T86_06125 [Pirellulales bacterium]|nr:hypothetical protein [Pirellulales bacterium]
MGVLGTLPLPMDYEIERFTRHCAASGRVLAEGEEFYSVLVADGGKLRRTDYSAAAWQGPPAEAIGWWKSRVPTRQTSAARLAPGEVLLNLLQQLEGVEGQEELRYLLALWLVRRRVLKLDETRRAEDGREVLTLYAPGAELHLEVAAVPPAPDRAAELEAYLGQLLFAEAT